MGKMLVASFLAGYPTPACLMTESEQPRAVRHGLVRREQHDVAGFIRKAERQHFRHELADLARREVDDGGDLPPDQRAAS